MFGWLWRTFADPQIERHLLLDEGEHVVDEVRHHWVVHVLPAAECLVAVGFAGLMVVTDLPAAWIPLALALGFGGHGVSRALGEHMDRFVITNMRVFRTRGIVAQQLATVPISRILDITVDKPLTGRLLGYGHFVFESAAQEQGLRDIRYVGRPDERDLTIQRVIQRSGLRASVRPVVASD